MMFGLVVTSAVEVCLIANGSLLSLLVASSSDLDVLRRDDDYVSWRVAGAPLFRYSEDKLWDKINIHGKLHKRAPT